MSMSDKQTLCNELVIYLSENYNLNVKELKSNIGDILQNYHITVADESFDKNDLSTSFLLNKFTEGKKAIGMSDNTIRQYKIAIQKLEEYTDKKIADIEADDVTNFFMKYKSEVSSVTLKGKYQLICSVYNWLYARRYIPHNPMTLVSAPKADVVLKNPLSDYQLEKIKNACELLKGKESLRDMALVYFFTSTGCRVSELRNIKIGDVDFEKKICKVMGKGRKERFVVLNDKTVFRLNLYLEKRKNKNSTDFLFASIRGKEHGITKDGIEHIINKLRKLAGVEKLTCHVFRRFYATKLRQRNVNIQVIAKSLGHANLNQINRYSLYDNTEMQNIIREAM